MTFPFVEAIGETSNIKYMITILCQTIQIEYIPVAFILNYSQFFTYFIKSGSKWIFFGDI
mgnify:CR=1 FL=1